MHVSFLYTWLGRAPLQEGSFIWLFVKSARVEPLSCKDVLCMFGWRALSQHNRLLQQVIPTLQLGEADRLLEYACRAYVRTWFKEQAGGVSTASVLPALQENGPCFGDLAVLQQLLRRSNSDFMEKAAC